MNKRTSTIVQKYGGSSVANLEKLGLVADRVVATHTTGHQVVVVVSAMGKTTDQLLLQAREVDSNPPRRELDMLVSTGERVSMALLSIAIQKRGVQAISFTGSQAGIITTNEHFDARIISVKPYRIEEELAKGKIVIVAGYQGVSELKEITTLGRGGSDTTAVALAAALEAERCEIYSDVDGVYSADPNLVEHAIHWPEVDYETLQMAAECGAKVLNAQAVEWAKRANIKLYARHSSQSYQEAEAHNGSRQTLVSQKLSLSEQTRVVAHERNLVLIRSRDPNSLQSLSSIGHPFQLAPKYVGFEKNMGIFAVYSLLNVPDWSRVKESFTQSHFEVCESIASVSLIGPELHQNSGRLSLHSMVSMLELEKIPMLGLFVSPYQMTLFTEEKYTDFCVRMFHDQTFSSKEVLYE